MRRILSRTLFESPILSELNLILSDKFGSHCRPPHGAGTTCGGSVQLSNYCVRTAITLARVREYLTVKFLLLNV